METRGLLQRPETLAENGPVRIPEPANPSSDGVTATRMPPDTRQP